MVFRNQDLGLHVLIDTGVLLFLLDHFIICSLVCEGWGSTNETAAWRWEGQRSKGDLHRVPSPLWLSESSPPSLSFFPSSSWPHVPLLGQNSSGDSSCGNLWNHFPSYVCDIRDRQLCNLCVWTVKGKDNLQESFCLEQSGDRVIGEDTFGRFPPGNVPFSGMKSTQTQTCAEVKAGVPLEVCSPNKPLQSSGDPQEWLHAQCSPLAMSTGSRYRCGLKRNCLESGEGHLAGFVSYSNVGWVHIPGPPLGS